MLFLWLKEIMVSNFWVLVISLGTNYGVTKKFDWRRLLESFARRKSKPNYVILDEYIIQLS